MRKALTLFGKAYGRWTETVSVFLVNVSAVVIFALTLLITYDVVARYVFRNPLPWTTEISSIMLVFIIFSGLGYATIEEKHINMDLLVKRLSLTRQKCVYLVTDVVGLIVLVLLTWQIYGAVQQSYKGQKAITASYLIIRQWLPESAIALGLTVFILVFALQIYRQARGLRK